MPVTLDHVLFINELAAQVNLYWKGSVVCSIAAHGGPTLALSFDSLSLGSVEAGVLYTQASPGNWSAGETSFYRLVQVDPETLGLYHQFPGAVGPPMLFRRAVPPAP